MTQISEIVPITYGACTYYRQFWVIERCLTPSMATADGFGVINAQPKMVACGGTSGARCDINPF